MLEFKYGFIDPILADDKIHTIRKDEDDLWKTGSLIEFVAGVDTPEFKHFKTEFCTSTQKIEFKWYCHNQGLVSESWGVKVLIDDVDVTLSDIVDQLVENDGFKDRDEFFKWDGWYKQNYIGKIIHWTNFKYNTNEQ